MGKKIRRKRREMDITQEQLAALVGISTSFVGHIERGTRVPSIETLYRICDALGVSADYLMGLEE
ncbi:MAG: helix-turn-helix transcriptional regulator [Bacteroidaceae bacterium]|nr:helix-turn-helix transcriptional regulator [Bacteroidaceae bacterium]